MSSPIQPSTSPPIDYDSMFRAEWRGVTGRAGFDFVVSLQVTEPEGQSAAVRLRMSPAAIDEMTTAIADYRRIVENSHSDKSSGSPHSDGSMTPGQNVCPPTKSSNAAVGE